MPEIPLIVTAIFVALIAGAALLLAIAWSARDMWHEHQQKRGGYIDLTPDRPRLGINKEGRRRR